MPPYLNLDLKTRPCCENASRSFRRTEGLDCDLPEISRNMRRISPRGYIKLLFLSPDLICLTSFPKAHARTTVDRDGHASERIQRNGSARQSSVTDPRGSEGPESTSGGQANGAPVRKPGASTLANNKKTTTPPAFCSEGQDTLLTCFSFTLQWRR